ncbi:OsmC family peroxiredoxin [Demequina sp. NBRC 110055]|uniref:OsmC family peroxiredoxin n=1 Tax=Demequina sp. NBRC 110055 TaxID=1570344 RepID=UPI0009FCC18A|nr:OsmC family peroxiredoxin [Demequina sp. NBRC 110055]
MAVHSKASTTWKGGLADGSGTTALASGVATVGVNWKARAEGSADTTTPEELLAAAHASCYSMALSHALGENGTPPTQIDVTAEVTFVPGEGVRSSVLTVSATVEGIDQVKFGEIAEDAKDNCPISKALGGVHLSLESATLLD